MTEQEIFDKAARHLLTQMKKSTGTYGVDPTPRCMYRGPNGLMCAAGPFIPNELYFPEMEGKSLFGKIKLAINRDSHVNVYFLKEIQNIHDIYATVDWFYKLWTLAKYHALSVAVLDEFLVRA